MSNHPLHFANLIATGLAFAAPVPKALIDDMQAHRETLTSKRVVAVGKAIYPLPLGRTLD